MNEALLPDSILKPLCKPFSKQADWFLELFELSHSPYLLAGSCLICFYALLEAADSSKERALAPLKHWIEENMEVSIENAETPKATYPVSLEAENFESFCSRTIEMVRADDSVDDETVSLRLKYKERRAA